MNPVLIYLRPLDRRTNTRVDVRLGDAPSADAYGTGSVEWAPGIVARPTMSIELMSPDMDGRVQAGQARFTISLNRVAAVPNPETLYWRGASVVIHNTGVLEGDTAIPDFWGNVTSENVSLDGRTVQITAEVSVAFLDKPLLTGSFTGGGGLDGDTDKRGVLFPAGFGAQQNIPPVWFDQTNNIGMIDGYANCTAITWAGEGLSSLGPPVGNYADYAALLAAVQNKTIPPGRWGISVQPNKPALIALGAPPVGVITVHATFGANRTGAMIRRILLTHAKLPAARVDDASLTALDAAVDRAVHYWTSEQRQVKDLLEALAQGANATPIVTFQNQVAVTRAVLGAPVATLDRSGAQEPRVLDWRATSSEPPFYKMTARGARPALVLSLDQVNYVDTLIDRGLYKSDVVYRRGNLVTTTDEAQWVYTNEIADKGHAPPYVNGVYQSSDAWWTNIKPPASYSGTPLYNDGTPIDALRPADQGATRGAPNGTPVGGTDAATLVANAASALAQLNTIQSDGLLSVDEKPAVIAIYAEIANNHSTLGQMGQARGVSTTALQQRKDELDQYLGGLGPPAWNSLSGPTALNSHSGMYAYFDRYYQARTSLLAAIDGKARDREDLAVTRATQAAADNYLNGSEKRDAVVDRDGLSTRLARLVESHNRLGQPADSLNARTAAGEAFYNQLLPYLNTLNLADTTTGTDIVPATYIKKWSDAVSAINAFEAAMVGAANLDTQAAVTAIRNASDDDKWTPQEKFSTIVPSNNRLEAAYTLLRNQAVPLLQKSNVVGQATSTADNARTNWMNYLQDHPGWDNFDTTTIIDRPTANARLTAYGQALDALGEALRGYAQIVATSAQARTDAIDSDGKLSRGEKPGYVQDWQVLNNDLNACNLQNQAIGYPSSVQSASSNANSKVQSLGSYLGGLPQRWDDANFDTDVAANDIRAFWVDARSAVGAYLAALAGRASTTPTPTPPPPPPPATSLDIKRFDNTDIYNNWRSARTDVTLSNGGSANFTFSLEATNNGGESSDIDLYVQVGLANDQYTGNIAMANLVITPGGTGNRIAQGTFSNNTGQTYTFMFSAYVVVRGSQNVRTTGNSNSFLRRNS